jgi:hypothetical protein
MNPLPNDFNSSTLGIYIRGVQNKKYQFLLAMFFFLAGDFSLKIKLKF